VGIAAVLAGCGSSSNSAANTSKADSSSGSAASAVMKISSASPSQYFQVVAASKFADRVNELSKGKIKATVYANSELAGEVATLNGLQLGTIECYVGSTASATTSIPAFGVLDFPYLFETDAHYFRVMASSIGKALSSAAEAQGIHVLDYWAGGVRDVYNNGKLIREPADMKGMKLRVIQSPVYTATFQAWGAIPTPLASGEVYVGLEQGTLTGAETALTVAVLSKEDEVVKYASLTHHQYTSAMLAVSKQWWDGLSPALQDVINQAAAEATPSERDGDAAALASAVAAFQQAGKTVVTPDRAAFKAIALKVRPQFYTTYPQATFSAIESMA
jgi:tripartite ATP-independent transporter DctP family solute receptor